MSHQQNYATCPPHGPPRPRNQGGQEEENRMDTSGSGTARNNRALLDAVRPAPLLWPFHEGTGVLFHVEGCKECDMYISHLVEAKAREDASLMESMEKIREFYCGEFADQLEDTRARGREEGKDKGYDEGYAIAKSKYAKLAAAEVTRLERVNKELTSEVEKLRGRLVSTYRPMDMGGGPAPIPLGEGLRTIRDHATWPRSPIPPDPVDDAIPSGTEAAIHSDPGDMDSSPRDVSESTTGIKPVDRTHGHRPRPNRVRQSELGGGEEESAAVEGGHEIPRRHGDGGHDTGSTTRPQSKPSTTHAL